ncbi:potassium channel subfamily K member 5b [Hippoglossus hippoglossus]|uniref:potassium channel subfamily K member 5b n=1 Tax=Hippoglossus hippoglossus TaxID=8267 RepID=UPI00148D142D|nr:potassium channel subfamily K member 5b [Hippoglossus hippoglossus]XP_035020354.1 potassium channel subfamily K member 5b [Hippoglossus stenolepis]
MADKGPFLTSCIIFYLSVGAAIFQILEEPNWMSARDKYILQKENVLKKYTCLTKEALDEILEIVSEAAGQGVTITGEKHRNTWDWVNSVVFAATIVTTIGYGNVAPKTEGGRVFCILYGLCGIPLCLVWISELGSFFGDRAKRLSQVLIRKGVSVKKVQLTCTALFLLWGLFVHLVIPPFVFMSVEGWSYLEGIYFSFITLTTVGFGDYVAGVNPNIEYPRLYRTFAEIWIYMGLAWLSLFFSWNVHMVVEAHKKFKQRRHRYRNIDDEEPQQEGEKQSPHMKQSVIDIFNFLSENGEDYSTVIHDIGSTAKNRNPEEKVNRSKSCSDILAIRNLDHSPSHKHMISISQVFMTAMVDQEEERPPQESNRDSEPPECARTAGSMENKDSCTFEPENDGIIFTVPARDAAEEQTVQQAGGGESRFQISKVNEDLFKDKDEKG